MVKFSPVIEAWHSIAKNKLFYSITIILQLIFVGILGMLLFSYSQSILEPLQNINENIMSQQWMQELPTQENLKDLNIPATDVAAIDKEKQKMEIATIKLYLSFISLFIAIGGIMWLLSYRVALNQSWKEGARSMLKFIVAALVGLTALSALINIAVILLAAQFFVPNAGQTFSFVLPLFVSMIILYFMPVSFALAATTPLKDLMQKTLQVGIRKCVFLFSFYGIVLSVVMGLAIALFKLANISFMASLAVSILMLAFLTFSRIVLIKGLEEKS